MQYRLTQLKRYPQTVSSRATCINERGDILIVCPQNGKSYLWTGWKKPDLIDFYPSNLNNRGDMSGQYQDAGRSLGIFGGLGNLFPIIIAPSTQISGVTSLNDRQQAVGFLGDEEKSLHPGVTGIAVNPFVWKNQSLQYLAMPADYVAGYPSDINNQGDIVGGVAARFGSADPSQPDQAIYWSNDNFVLIDSPPEFPCSNAIAVNDHELILVRCWSQQYPRQTTRTTPSEFETSFLWRDGKRELLTPPASERYGAFYAAALNNHGHVVGKVTTNDGAAHACLWKEGEFFDLNSAIDASAGWEPIAANDISDHGQIVGSGIFQGREQAFLLTPAEMADSVSETDANTEAPPAGAWCVVANIVEFREHGEDHEIRYGTKHFRGGTKVYCTFPWWGDGGTRAKVVGRHRGSNRFVTMAVPIRHLTNWRAKVVYDPYVLEEIEDVWDGSAASKTRVHEIVDMMIRRQAQTNGSPETTE